MMNKMKQTLKEAVIIEIEKIEGTSKKKKNNVLDYDKPVSNSARRRAASRSISIYEYDKIKPLWDAIEKGVNAQGFIVVMDYYGEKMCDLVEKMLDKCGWTYGMFYKDGGIAVIAKDNTAVENAFKLLKRVNTNGF